MLKMIFLSMCNMIASSNFRDINKMRVYKSFSPQDIEISIIGLHYKIGLQICTFSKIHHK